ncbi:MAG: NADP-dependent phosphogluconate dehydrogenase [Ferruginibacter sp.]
MQEFGIIGLGVMGKSLSRNMARKGVGLSLYSRHATGEKSAESFIAGYPELSAAQGFHEITSFVHSLQKPHKILLMVPAGEAVDEMLTQLLPQLTDGDVIIDGGNSFYKDTNNRYKELLKAGVLYIGTGISGGEAGALNGPSIMAGGAAEGYLVVKDLLEAIAAKDNAGGSCCAFTGKGGAGHFVKMIHNGIEYAEMQLVAELYSILRFTGGYQPAEIAGLFKSLLTTSNSSYLLEITTEILQQKENDQWLIDIILDKAGNKGTGGWTTAAGAELGVPVPTLTAALFARYQSAFLGERKEAAALYNTRKTKTAVDANSLFIAFRLARIINHHQGFHLIDAASELNEWNIDMAELARTWTNGCIIRSHLMNELLPVLKEQKRILQHPVIVQEIKAGIEFLNHTVAMAVTNNIPVPCLASAVQYFHSYIQEQSNANIIQAQRDYFGAHTYERKDDPSGKKYHTQWTKE